MKELIQKINLPGLLKPNRGALFSTIGTVFEQVKKDLEKAFNAHFPYLADMQKLMQHGKSLSIPRFTYDSDEEYRKRITAAAFYYTNAGGRTYTIHQLQEHFGNRYTLIEGFLRVHVKVLDFTDEDKTWLRNFFDSTLDPNILIALTEWFDFIEVVSLGDMPRITAVRKDRDIYPRGLRYDGRIRYDHGQEVRFDGSGTYNGSLNYSNVVSKKGTVSEFVKIAEPYNGVRTYGGEIVYSGDTEVWAPEDIQNSATYGDGNDDDAIIIQGRQQLADKAELYPTYDGRLSYGGVITYGGTRPGIVDESQMKIAQRIALMDAIESTDESSVIGMNKRDKDIYPSGLRYDGRINYDHGIAPRFDGQVRYDGRVTYDKTTPKAGTVLDSIHGDIATPAKYDSTSGEQDTLSDTVTVEPFEDAVEIRPLFDGKVSYTGAFTYGDSLPPLVDSDMQLKIIKHHNYDGKKHYGVRSYDGTVNYDGSMSYLGGATYSGNKEDKEAV
jgi:hypothetical protein